MKIIAVLATTRDGLIGTHAGTLPWDLPRDRALFRNLTLGQTIVVGRKTWNPSYFPLPGRRNVVLSRDAEPSSFPGSDAVYRTIEGLINEEKARGTEVLVIAGGGQIYEAFLEKGWIDEVYLSLVEHARPLPPNQQVFLPFDFEIRNDSILFCTLPPQEFSYDSSTSFPGFQWFTFSKYTYSLYNSTE